MKTFTYKPFFRFFYRYGNIPLTILLILYIVPLIINLDQKLTYFLPVIVILLLIYFLNRHYLTHYKILPYKIETDEEKLITSDYIFSKKKLEMYFKDITELKGGVFEGKLRGSMKVVDGKNQYTVAFYQNIKDAQLLQTIILSKVNAEVYNQTLENIKSRRKIKERGDK